MVAVISGCQSVNPGASLGQAMDQIKGLSGQMVMTTRGDYGTSTIDAETVSADLRAAFEGMSETLNGVSMGFPLDRVKPGSTWTVPLSKAVPMMGMGEMDLTGEMVFTLDRTEAREDGIHALLSFSGTQSQAMAGDPSAQLSMEMSASGQSTGSVDVNLDEGRVVTMTMTMTMVGEMAMMGMDIGLNSTTTMTQTLVSGS